MNLASQLAAINVLTDQNFKPSFFFWPKREIRTRSLIRSWLLLFTAPLGGCDMFLATEANHGATPLVIHSNRNNILNAVDNLRKKEQFVDRLLGRL